MNGSGTYACGSATYIGSAAGSRRSVLSGLARYSEGTREYCQSRRCSVSLLGVPGVPLGSAGEDVLAYVEREKPDVVFLDFDRTLASTKTGGSPLQGADLACRDAIS